MNDPLVSVIIPAYKQAEFIGAAIRSVLDQTYTNVEVIVVDDVSPDNTADVVRSFDDPRLHYILHDKNRMLAAARNTGMRAAHGEIFALLDADDYFDTKKIAMHVDYLRQNPQVGVSYNARLRPLVRQRWDTQQRACAANTDLWRAWCWDFPSVPAIWCCGASGRMRWTCLTRVTFTLAKILT